MAERDPATVVEITKGRYVVALPVDRQEELQLVFDDDVKEHRLVVCVPRQWRLDLAMALLTADGATADVKLRWPHKPRTKVHIEAPINPTPKPVKRTKRPR